MNPHFFTAPFYFAFIWFKVQGSRGGFVEILRLRSQLFWHSLSHIRRFSPLRMTKRGDARRLYEMTLFSYRSLPLEGKVPRRGG